MLKNRLLLLMTVVLLLAAGNLPAWAATEARLALLIGNSNYKASPLLNPVNDVRLMEAALKESGFTVIKAENASIRDMRRLVRDFGDRLKTSGGVGLFYFAGHGVQVRGENFLVSTDSDIRNEDEIADDAINANTVLEKMQSAGNRMNLIILDACRNNPFAVKSRSAVAGLATMSAPSGSLVAYSTAPGSVASDGKGQNGLYTEYLAKVIRQPGLPVEEVFKQVRSAVRRDSNNQQTPWENTALEGQFFFKEAPPPQVAVVAAPRPPEAPRAVEAPVVVPAFDPVTLDLAFWESVKTSQRSSELQAYLSQFPKGVFAGLARSRIEDLRTPVVVAPPPAPALAPVPVPIAAAPPVVAQTKPAVVAMLGSAAAPAVAVTTPVFSQPGSLGTLILTESFNGQRRSIDVAVEEATAKRTLYTSGDAIGADGKVQQVRVGDVVLRAVAGDLWSLPLKEGAFGEAEVVRADQSAATGNVKWKATAAAGGRIRIDAVVSYASFGVLGAAGPRMSAYGPWTATYSSAPLPDSSSSVIRAPYVNNIISSEFKPRN